MVSAEVGERERRLGVLYLGKWSWLNCLLVQVVKITWPKFLLQLREALALDSRIELDESDMMAMQTVYLH